MKVLKLLLKFFLLPFVLLFGTVILLCKLASNLSSHAVSLLMLLLFICGIITVSKQQWNQTVLLFGAEVICFAALFFVTWLIDTAEEMNCRLVDFLRS